MTSKQSKSPTKKPQLSTHKFNAKSYIVMETKIRRDANTGRLTNTNAKIKANIAAK